MKTKSTHNPAEIESLKQKVIDLVSNSPSKAVTILTEWLDAAQKPRKTGAEPSKPLRIKKAG